MPKQTKREEREGPQRRGGQRGRGKRGEGRSERRIRRRRSDVGTSKADPWLDGDDDDDGELRHCGVCMVDAGEFLFLCYRFDRILRTERERVANPS